MADPRITGFGTKILTQPYSPQGVAHKPQGGKSFIDSLKESIDKVEQDQQSADKAMQDLAVGRARSLHESMITVEEANISFKMMMAVRGKLINAYHEVMRMSF